MKKIILFILVLCAGHENFAQKIIQTLPTSVTKRAIFGDFNGDNVTDIAIVKKNKVTIFPGYYKNENLRFDMENLLVFSKDKFKSPKRSRVYRETGDINGDGLSDIVCWTTVYDEVWIWKFYNNKNSFTLSSEVIKWKIYDICEFEPRFNRLEDFLKIITGGLDGDKVDDIIFAWDDCGDLYIKTEYPNGKRKKSYWIPGFLKGNKKGADQPSAPFSYLDLLTKIC